MTTLVFNFLIYTLIQSTNLYIMFYLAATIAHQGLPESQLSYLSIQRSSFRLLKFYWLISSLNLPYTVCTSKFQAMDWLYLLLFIIISYVLVHQVFLMAASKHFMSFSFCLKPHPSLIFCNAAQVSCIKPKDLSP